MEDDSEWAGGLLLERPDAPTEQAPAGGAGPRQRWQASLGLVAVLAVAAALAALRQVPATLGDYGLPPALPVVWYLALLTLVLSACVVLAARTFKPWLSVLHLLALVVVLYGTGVILAGAPRFAWSYKHIGVTNYITQFGQVDPGLDLYHRWPGFFSLTSTYGALAGLPNAASYAAWSGLLFVVLESLLVVAIARTQLDSSRAAWAAGLVFACVNWVGQDYFAPQPFGFTLGLGVLWLTLVHFQTEPAGRVARVVTRVLGRLFRREGGPRLSAAPRPLWRPAVAVVVITVTYVAIVPSHQLTPYLVVLVLGLLALLGGVRPWRLVLVLAALALAYLIPNLGYVLQHYDLFSGLNPFRNAGAVNDLDTAAAGKVWNVRAGLALTVVFWLAAFVALVRAWRAGRAGVLHAAVAFLAPFLILLTARYGGEGSIRVILFAAPWAAVLIASAVVERRPVRNLLLAPVLALFLVLFLPAYYGAEETNRIPASEVTASQYLYRNGQDGAVVVASAPNFPLRSDGRYAVMQGDRNAADPVLTRQPQFRQPVLGLADVGGVVNAIHRYGSQGYVVFSDSQEEYVEVFGVTTTSALRSLEQAMLDSGRFHLYYTNSSTRIYELVA